MCLQDIQLARALTVKSTEISVAGAVTQKIADADQSRVGFVILGPTANSLVIRAGGGGGQSTIGFYAPSSSAETRAITILSHGPIVQLELHGSFANALICTLIEYFLPMDRDQLQRLANQGKF